MTFRKKLRRSFRKLLQGKKFKLTPFFIACSTTFSFLSYLFASSFDPCHCCRHHCRSLMTQLSVLLSPPLLLRWPQKLHSVVCSSALGALYRLMALMGRMSSRSSSSNRESKVVLIDSLVLELERLFLIGIRKEAVIVVAQSLLDVPSSPHLASTPASGPVDPTHHGTLRLNLPRQGFF